MQQKFTLSIVLFFGTLFTILFHDQPLGLNLIIFEITIIGWLFYSKQISFRYNNSGLLIISQAVTCLFTILTHSTFIYIVHFIVSLVFAGVIIYPGFKSVITPVRLSISNLLSSQISFLRTLVAVEYRNQRPMKMMWEMRLFIIPMIIVSVFMFIYNKSNPKFNELTTNAATGFFDLLNIVFENYDFTMLLTFIAGVLLCNLILFRNVNSSIVLHDLKSNDLLSFYRQKILVGCNKISLKNEFKSAMFLLIILNTILLVVNIIDIKWVWFGFEWEGQYLKQFVHEGTYLLIVSILISIAIVLYFFRGGINHIRNKSLKRLSYLWLFQNLILAISVGIRNYYYIEHFNFAYKRIGVIIFLMLTVYGLYSVIKKVNNKYAPFYLFRKNFMTLLMVLIGSSLINWDSFIARYNFSHSDRSFIHYNFLSRLSDSALPYLDKSPDELKQIDLKQSEKFTGEPYYMNSAAYYKYIQKRKNNFRTKWESKGWLSWNLPEQLAYNNLFVIKK